MPLNRDERLAQDERRCGGRATSRKGGLEAEARRVDRADDGRARRSIVASSRPVVDRPELIDVYHRTDGRMA
jgi:hypothetical protein